MNKNKFIEKIEDWVDNGYEPIDVSVEDLSMYSGRPQGKIIGIFKGRNPYKYGESSTIVSFRGDYSKSDMKKKVDKAVLIYKKILNEFLKGNV